MKKALYIFASFGIFAALLIFPKAAAEAVKAGLIMCAQMIMPSLFPFFIAANLLNELGASKLTANALAPLGARLGMSGHGVSAFIIGVTGCFLHSAAESTGAYRPRRCLKAHCFLQQLRPCVYCRCRRGRRVWLCPCRIFSVCRTYFSGTHFRRYYLPESSVRYLL